MSLTRADLAETGASIEAVQLPSGMIPWFEGGHADPWNHVEAAMALSATGRVEAAERAYEWLCATQREDGAWHAYYTSAGEVEEPRLDTNVTAYIATGVRQHHAATGDDGFLEEMWPALERAIDWALRWQAPSGALAWSVSPDGVPGGFALLAASSSACMSLSSAIACAQALGRERPHWEAALRRLALAVAFFPGGFLPKDEFAMDWYYPVLSGALSGGAAELRVDAGWRSWVVEGHGVRCRSDGEWVTAAETAECALACIRLGRRQAASRLLHWVRELRGDGGSYATGTVRPEGAEFPLGERTTYSAAAVVLAGDALAGSPAAAALLSPLASSPPAGALASGAGHAGTRAQEEGDVTAVA